MSEPTPIILPPVDPNPQTNDTVLVDVFEPQRHGAFFTAMLRTAAANSAGIFNFGTGDPLFRLVDLVAQQLELLSFSFADVLRKGIREGAYRAWRHPQLFPERAPATFARGFARFGTSAPLNESELIPLGALIGTPDGRTVRVTEDTVFPAGNTEVLVSVASETPGRAGEMPPGALAKYLSGPQNYFVTNPWAITGGFDEESDEEVHARFREYVESRTTGNTLAVLSAVKNARVGDQRVRDAALVQPWRIPGMNQLPGACFAVIDAGYAGASNALIDAARANVELVRAANESVTVLPANAWVVSPTVRVSAARGSVAAEVSAAVTQAWTDLCAASLIEDGLGRGRVSLFDVTAALEAAHPAVVTIRVQLDEDLQPPIGARVMAGAPTVHVTVGSL